MNTTHETLFARARRCAPPRARWEVILMHFPISFPYMTNECTSAGYNNTQCRHETWAGLSAAREKGLVRNLGVSNFNVKQLKDLEEFGGAPMYVSRSKRKKEQSQLQETRD